jgi:acyl carrier protein
MVEFTASAAYNVQRAPKMLSKSIRSAILYQFERVAREQKRNLSPLSDDLVLTESGLDSLCFAVIVARLEDELGVDPFSAAEGSDFPVTLGDFVEAYESVLK